MKTIHSLATDLLMGSARYVEKITFKKKDDDDDEHAGLEYGEFQAKAGYRKACFPTLRYSFLWYLLYMLHIA